MGSLPPRLGTPPTPTAPTPTAPTPTAPPPPPVVVAPPPAAAEPQVQYVYVKPAAPAWLVTLGVFAGLLGAGYAFYSLVLNKSGASAAPAAVSERKVDEPDAAPGATRNAAKLTRHLEATGVRIVEENKRPQIRIMLVNHSSAEMASLKGSVTLNVEGKTEALAVIPFTLASLGAFEAKEITAPLKTKLRAYELPDWQFMRAQVTLASAE